MKRARWGRSVTMGAVAVVLAVGLTACWPFNTPPTAVIVADHLTGTSPLTVQFDATQSKDPDGEITMTTWDFGDESTSEAPVVSHKFYASSDRAVYNVTLTVVDNAFATDRATQTIEVLPAEGGGAVGDPVARIVPERVIGRTPLTVSFDGRTSSGGGGTIVQYQWHFGDGSQATGPQVFHEYRPDTTQEYTVWLYVWNDQGVLDAEQMTVIAIVPTDDGDAENPTAEMNMTTPLLLYVEDDDPATPITIPTRYEVRFDPRGSYADAGNVLDYYVWDFGDGHSVILSTDDIVSHVYELTAPAWTYIVRLTVYDNHGLEATTTANLTLVQPEPDSD